MRPEGNWRRLQIITVFVCGATISACATAPVTLTVTPTSASAAPQYGSKDYPQALAAIMAGMGKEWDISRVGVSGNLYSCPVFFESGRVREMDPKRHRYG